MSSPAAIEFDRVWKCFPRHADRMLLRARLRHFLPNTTRTEPFYALRDVSFRVHPGESVAVLGANGAGKSTLLSLVAGLAPPDKGRISVRGRVAPLLELAAGFHGDLTGIENLSLNAALLGIRRKELDAVMSDIIDFAELADFIHEPLRTYSSGMIMRLAFSVAVNINPDVLLIDEILAVGDSAFQAKSFERVLDFRRRGKTILCVSHSPVMAQRLCDRAIWLDHGALMLDGPLEEVADVYEGKLRAQRNA